MDEPSVAPSISGNGARVAFQSFSDRLVRGDDNGHSDIFVRNVRAGTTRLVSGGVDGAAADGASTAPSISANGRYVTFTSGAGNLVAADGNGVDDAFRHDLRTGRTIRVSGRLPGFPSSRQVSVASISADGSRVAFVVTAGGRWEVFVRKVEARRTVLVSRALDGGMASGASFHPRISADGRYVVFLSDAGDLVGRDSNGTTDVFRHDLRQRRTVLVSKDSSGGPADAPALGGAPAISPRGRFVVFHSEATDLVTGDTNGEPDVFMRDLGGRSTLRMSVTSAEEQVSGFGSFHTVRMGVTVGGRFVAFSSDFSGLTPDDDNGQPDVFVRAVASGTTVLVSRDTAGTSPPGFSTEPSISRDGSFVAFSSDAPGLSVTDTNVVNDVFRARLS